MDFLSHIILICCIVASQWPLTALADDKPWLIPKNVRFRPDGKVGMGHKYGQYETGTYNGVWYTFWFKDGSGSFYWQTAPSTELPRNTEGKETQKRKKKGDRNAELDANFQKLTQNLEELAQKLANIWNVFCRKDPIYDVKSCTMGSHGLWIDVNEEAVNKQRRVRVSVGVDHAPGSTIAIRINDEPPFVSDTKAGFDVQTSTLIIQKLTTNPKVITRYTKWPNTYPTDETFQVSGFSEIYEYINWAVQQIK